MSRVTIVKYPVTSHERGMLNGIGKTTNEEYSWSSVTRVFRNSESDHKTVEIMTPS
jgi:hypothetical protein